MHVDNPLDTLPESERHVGAALLLLGLEAVVPDMALPPGDVDFLAVAPSGHSSLQAWWNSRTQEWTAAADGWLPTHKDVVQLIAQRRLSLRLNGGEYEN